MHYLPAAGVIPAAWIGGSRPPDFGMGDREQTCGGPREILLGL